MNVRPLHDRIIIQRLDEGEQKVGGIIIPDSAKEKPQQGKVIAAGNGKSNDDGKRVPLDVKAGDLILFGKYSGQEIKLDGEEYIIMREDEVLGRHRRRRREEKEVGDKITWQNRLSTASTHGRPCCAASTSWPTRSR